MRSATAQADIGATPAALWGALTSPDQTRRSMVSCSSSRRPRNATCSLLGCATTFF